MQQNDLSRKNLSAAKRKWPTQMDRHQIQTLRLLTQGYQFSVAGGDLLLLEGGWYVTHTGLIRLASRRRCRGINVQPIDEFSDARNHRYVFKAIVYKSRTCQGFDGYGDADPSNVSSLVHGAEMRVAKPAPSTVPCAKLTASASAQSKRSVPYAERSQPSPEPKKLPPQPDATEMAVARFAIASAKSSASINSIPTWSRLTRPISAA